MQPVAAVREENWKHSRLQRVHHDQRVVLDRRFQLCLSLTGRNCTTQLSISVIPSASRTLGGNE